MYITAVERDDAKPEVRYAS